MATIVTVHGTFAHAAGSAGQAMAPPVGEPQWWQQGGTFEADMRELLAATPGFGSGKLEFKPFVWSGDNSEVKRREAGKLLFRELMALERSGEPYAVVGHSHGGTVISWALLESAARKRPLDGLKRWVTVGTPFVAMKKERWLFQRLPLTHKVIFVASFMLLAMFLVYLAAEALSGSAGQWLFGGTFLGVLLFAAAMMSLPMIFFWGVLKFWDQSSHHHYRRSVRERARHLYAERWLSLTHTDDEAVQGLAFLPGAKLSFFEKSFAVSALTMLSIVALPLVYLVFLASPTIMVTIGDWVKTNVYERRSDPALEATVRGIREEARKQWRSQLRPGARTTRLDPTFRASRAAAWAQYRAKREELIKQHPTLPAAERSLRFKGRFFERDGMPCEDGKLCGKGRDFRINSGLLLHLVTDELSSSLVGEGSADLWRRSIWSLVIPAVFVPIMFGLLALALMLVIRTLAKAVSAIASHALNSITNSEVKRAAFGNDTEGEIAIGAVDRPGWIERSPPRLPVPIGDIVTAYSNGIATQSLAKFRSAIGQLASAEPKHSADTAITTYFTWKELVHASYFDVPEFRRLVAQGIARGEGFTTSERFEAHPDFVRTSRWLAEIEGQPGETQPLTAGGPTPSDNQAVRTVVAATLKPPQ